MCSLLLDHNEIVNCSLKISPKLYHPKKASRNQWVRNFIIIILFLDLKIYTFFLCNASELEAQGNFCYSLPLEKVRFSHGNLRLIRINFLKIGLFLGVKK